jgi:hypothetical protein
LECPVSVEGKNFKLAGIPSYDNQFAASPAREFPGKRLIPPPIWRPDYRKRADCGKIPKSIRCRKGNGGK